MKKRKNFGRMMMGMMGGGHIPTPVPINNPVVFLSAYPALSETSIVDQESTTITIQGTGIISRHFQAVGSQFTIIVNIVIYAPNASIDPMAVFDQTPPHSNGNAGASRLYSKVFQYGFGNDNNAYQHAMFYINNIPPVDGKLDITIKHPPCKRRIVTVDQFANLTSSNPIDVQAAKQSPTPGTIQITSGLTTTSSQVFELAYGSIAIGRNFDQYSEPQGWVPIQSVGSNIDPFDATLKTYYKLTAQQSQYGLSALVSTNSQPTNFVWSAVVQTFEAAQP